MVSLHKGRGGRMARNGPLHDHRDAAKCGVLEVSVKAVFFRRPFRKNRISANPGWALEMPRDTLI
jgi:hypothetical protein